MDDSNATFTLQPAVDMAAICVRLGTMKAIYANIDESLRALGDQHHEATKLGPTMDTVKDELHALSGEVKAHDELQKERVAEVHTMIKEKIKSVAGDQLRKQIREQIQLEVAKQVEEQVDFQIREHLPVTLAQQAEDSHAQIVEVKHALANSEARRKNAWLRPSPSSMNDTLEVVLKPDGTKSALYPANLRSLFSYDSAKALELIKDFGLHDHGVLEKNLNRFMAHIGIRFELVPVSASRVTSPKTRPVLVPPTSPAK